MKSSIGPVTRMHEWAADRFSFIQYPEVRKAVQKRQQRQPLRFKTAMPLYQRLGLLTLSLFLIAIGTLLMSAIGFAIWLFVF